MLYRSEVRRLDLKEGNLIDAKTSGLIDEVLRKRAKKRSLFLLQKKDYTESQMRKKLKEGCYPSDIIDETIEYLYLYHYLDDVRYAMQYVRFHGEQKSRRMLVQKLMEKGLKKEVIDEALSQYEGPSEEEQIAVLIRKKNFDPQSSDEKQRQKMMRFLIARGYSYEAVKHAVSNSSHA